MKVAHIPPISLLNTVVDEPFHLILVHILEASRIYADFYRAQRDMGHFIILDNGAFELKGSVEFALMRKWAKILKPQEFVLPDHLRNASKTLSSTYAMLREMVGFGKMQYMAVPQGRTLSEWLGCLEEMLRWRQITTIGIYEETADFFPVEGKKYGRMPLLRLLESMGLHKERDYHLLGFDEGLVELRLVPKEFPWVRSTDSAKAIVFGMNNVRLSNDLRNVPAYPGRPKDYFDWKPTAATRPEIELKVLANLTAIRQFSRDEEVV